MKLSLFTHSADLLEFIKLNLHSTYMPSWHGLYLMFSYRLNKYYCHGFFSNYFDACIWYLSLNLVLCITLNQVTNKITVAVKKLVSPLFIGKWNAVLKLLVKKQALIIPAVSQ